MTVLRSFRLWVAAVALLAVSVLVLPAPASTWQTRAAHLESLVKCPSCDNLSVAQSTSASALAVRAQIVRMVRQGAADTQILTTIEQAYGPSVLLTPPSGGLTTALWLSPLVLIAGGVAIVVRVRRR